MTLKNILKKIALTAIIAALPQTAMASDNLNTPDFIDAIINTPYTTIISSFFLKEFGNAIGNLGQNGYNAFAHPTLIITSYLFVLSLIMRTGKLLLGMEEGMEYIKHFVRYIFIFLFVQAMIGGVGSGLYWEFLWKLPINITGKTITLFSTIAGNQNGTCPTLNAADFLNKTLLCINNNLQTGINTPFRTGLSMIAASNNHITLSHFFSSLGIMLTTLFVGCIIALTTLGASFYIVLALCDTIFTLTILTTFAPLLIACVMLKVTRQYAMNGLKTLLGVFLNLVGLCIGINFIETLFHTIKIQGHTLDQSASQAMQNMQQGDFVNIFEGMYIALLILTLAMIPIMRMCAKSLSDLFDTRHTEHLAEMYHQTTANLTNNIEQSLQGNND